ncbi:protein SYS1 homolog [Acanthaster planci]|uniref:Protein SYS1 homolog n=1 Tax=Acanthaster planci TaxID=133434 RepID=A0A8B7ZPL3_ACAPL|nr:protein SYS1 homolog [Acanthaster planci]XP_022107523.1 protein SYS1 homolog [Acanthaster planci]
MVGSFRSHVWDPVLLISQIVSMQCTFYVCYGFWLVLIDLILDNPRVLDQVFKYECLEFGSSKGRTIVAVYVLNSLTCALGLWVAVGRAKQCTDFALTVHMLHLVACWAYNRQFPHTLSWWLVNIVCVALMTVLGEFLCMRSEMKAIPLSTAARSDL